MLKLRNIVLASALILLGLRAVADEKLVAWTVSSRPVKGDVYEVVFQAAITSPWHMYGLGPYGEYGPNPTAFTIQYPAGVTPEGKVYAITQPKEVNDPNFGQISYYEKSAQFGQKVKVTVPKAVLTGMAEWMLCDDKSCLPPDEYDFSVTIENKSAAVAKPAAQSGSASGTASAVDKTAGTAARPVASADPANEVVVLPADADSVAVTADTIPAAVLTPAMSVGGVEEPGASKSLWSTIIEAILWGFAALLTPCVFPMVPMTVSFFMKSGEDKARGRFKALMYGVFIVGLYTLPIAAIILITRVVGGDAVTADIFNWLATHWLPNVVFFLVFMIFAASFFGAFEITMPSWMVNKSDQKADKGGFGGLFFMALTLVLVSFSCTGPIVGSVLIKSTAGEFWEPIVTMLAFSTAFALPFVLFAFFPSLLKDLPKSGGWLNSVKVVLGFIEVALGFKFLSVADQTYHWGLLDREIYLAIWIVVFSLLGAYLLGKLKFAHDSEVKHISVTRLFLSIATFSFVVYLVPGMFGAPLKGLSGYLPPMHTQDFVLGGEGSAPAQTAPAGGKAPKYSDFLHLPHNLSGYFDYEEGMAYARSVGKPVMIDFTGHGCVNCREMEARVWSAPEVLNILRNDYVIIALYSDDKKELPESDWMTTENGKVLKSLGKINSYFARTRFGANAQPYYLLLDGKGEQLAPARGYDLSVPGFEAFLKEGLQQYKARQNAQ